MWSSCGPVVQAERRTARFLQLWVVLSQLGFVEVYFNARGSRIVFVGLISGKSVEIESQEVEGMLPTPWG